MYLICLYRHVKVVLQVCKFYMYKLIDVKMIKDKMLCTYIRYIHVYIHMYIYTYMYIYVYIYSA